MKGRAERIAASILAPLLVLLGLAVPVALLGASAADILAQLDIFASPAVVRASLHTLIAGGASALGAGLLGGGFALVAELTDLPHRRALAFLFLLLMIIPAQVSAIAWITLVGPASPVLAPFGLAPRPGTPIILFGPGGIIFLMAVEHAPIVFLILSGYLRAIPGAIIEAAQSAGAGPWRTLGHVLLPLSLPAIAAGISGAFAAGISNFATPALLGIPGRYSMLTTLIYQHLTGFGPGELASVTLLSLLLAVFCLAAVAIERMLSPAAASLAATGARAERFALGRCRLPVEALCWLTLGVLLVLPLAALIGTATTRAYGQNFGLTTMSLMHFRVVLFEEAATRRAFANSILLALLAGALLALLAVTAADRARGSLVVKRALALAEIPYVLPGTALGIGCILLFLRPILGVSLYGTLTILLIAYLMRFFALARRPVQAVLDNLDPAIEEMAASLGAGYGRRLISVMGPLLAPAAAAGALLVILGAFSELTISALLWSAGNETVGVMIFNLEQGGELSAAAALSVLAALVTLLLLGAAAFAARGRDILPWQQ